MMYDQILLLRNIFLLVIIILHLNLTYKHYNIMFLFHFQCKHDTIFLTILYPFILLGGSYYPMKNQEIIQDIVSYIYDAMRKKGLTSRGLAKICEEQGASLSSIFHNHIYIVKNM